MHGTIDVPRDALMNWAGGFTSDMAAGGHISSGGIPSIGITRGGSIHHYQMEHIWVEAAIDYLPSRGAVNRDADTWLPIDASFKQYDEVQGYDLNAIAPFDAYTFVQDYQATTVTDPYGGVTGGDPALIQNAITQRQLAIDTYVQTNDPYATVQDVIGGRNIRQMQWPYLPSSLPNKIVARGASYGALPTQLEYRVSFEFQGMDSWGNITPGTPITLPFAQLNNEKVTVSYRPASPGDEQVLASFLPAGPITDINQLPSSIPVYLVNVIPELKVNGQVVLEGARVQMGTDHRLQAYIYDPAGGSRCVQNNFEAGTFHAMGVFGGAISKGALQARQNQINTHLQEWDSGNFANYDRETVHGDALYSGMLTYFTQYYAITGIQAQASSTKHLLQPSIGTLGSKMNVRYFFGFPRTGSSGGVVMNIGKLVSVTTAKSGVADERLAFVKTAGMLGSALEHMVPEQMFSTQTMTVQAVSTVKLLNEASSVGMPVYYINQQNASQILPQLNLNSPLAMGEINAAIAAGKEVTVHQSQLTVGGWTGVGYSLVDPATGDGQYRISSGLNGGELPNNPNIEGLGLMSNVLSGMVAYLNSSTNPPTGAFGMSFLRVLGAAIGSMLTLLDLWAACPGADISFLIGMSIMYFSILAVVFFMAPGVGLIVGFGLSYLLSYITDTLATTPICSRP